MSFQFPSRAARVGAGGLCLAFAVLVASFSTRTAASNRDRCHGLQAPGG